MRFRNLTFTIPLVFGIFTALHSVSGLHAMPPAALQAEGQPRAEGVAVSQVANKQAQGEAPLASSNVASSPRGPLAGTFDAHAATPKMTLKRHHTMLETAQHLGIDARGQHQGAKEDERRLDSEKNHEQNLGKALMVSEPRNEGNSPQSQPQGKITNALQHLMNAVGMLDGKGVDCPGNQSYRTCVPPKNSVNPPNQKCETYTRCAAPPSLSELSVGAGKHAVANEANLTKIDVAAHEHKPVGGHAGKWKPQVEHGHGAPATDAKVNTNFVKGGVASIYQALSNFFAALHDATVEADKTTKKLHHGQAGHGQHHAGPGARTQDQHGHTEAAGVAHTKAYDTDA